MNAEEKAALERLANRMETTADQLGSGARPGHVDYLSKDEGSGALTYYVSEIRGLTNGRYAGTATPTHTCEPTPRMPARPSPEARTAISEALIAAQALLLYLDGPYTGPNGRQSYTIDAAHVDRLRRAMTEAGRRTQ